MNACSLPSVIRLNLVLLLLAAASPVSAQVVPEGPITAFDGRIVVGGELTATLGTDDEDAYFNYTDYERNAMRMFRFALTGIWRPADRVAFVAELRTEDFDDVTPYAAYIRLRPWRHQPFDVQAGRIPPSFGAFGRRTYGTDNPLIGYPLAYQYLTSLRSDAVPASVDELLRMRARGWQSSFSLGSSDEAPGVPLVSAFRWDTGVQVRWSAGGLQLTGSLTNGTLSSPRVADDNGGKQLSGRVAIEPATGLILGASAARGPWVSNDVPRAVSRSLMQTAYGADVEYSRGYWLVRGELVSSRWDLPWPDTSQGEGVAALATWIESRYRLTPRIYVAARADHLGFSKIAGGNGGISTWDAPVNRVELGGGYYLQRNLAARAAIQHNRRDGGRVRNRTYWSAQVSYWF